MHSSRSESIRAPILAILLIELFSLIARSYLQVELIKIGQPTALAKNLSYLVVPVIWASMMFPIFKQHRHFLSQRFKLANLTLRTIAIGVLVGILLRIAGWGQLIGFSALGIYRNDDPNAIIGPLFSFSCPPIETILVTLLVMTLLTPVIEEVINRGFLLYSFLRKGRLIAIVLSSVLFAVFHTQASIPSAFIAGLFLAVFALNSGSLWAPIAAHATHNGLVTLDWICLQVQWSPSETTLKLVGIGVSALLIGILSLVACSRLVSRECVGTDKLSQRFR